MNKKFKNIINHSTISIFDCNYERIGTLSHKPNMNESDIRSDVIEALEYNFNLDSIDNLQVTMFKHSDEIINVNRSLIVGGYQATMITSDEDYKKEWEENMNEPFDGKIYLSGLFIVDVSGSDIEYLYEDVDINKQSAKINNENFFLLPDILFYAEVIEGELNEEEFLAKYSKMFEE